MLNNLVRVYTYRTFQTMYMDWAIKSYNEGKEKAMWENLFEWMENKYQADKLFIENKDIFKQILVSQGQHKTGKI